MKRIISLLLCLLLVAGLFSGLTVTAFADSVDATIDAEVGEYFDEMVFEHNSNDTVVIEGYNGKPSWVTVYDGNGNMVGVCGTPTSAGTSYFEIYFTFNGEEMTACVTIVVTSAPGEVTLSAVTENLQVGKAFEKDYDDLSTGGEIFEAQVSGTLPKGMEWAGYDSYIALKGTPTEDGTFKVTLKALDDNSNSYRSIPVTLVVAPADIKVTKSPTSETVVEGGAATFISAAENYESIEWRVVTKDGSSCWRNEAEITAKFKGVEYNAYKGKDGREYLELTEIPLSMDGYYIQTKFFGPDGKTAFTEEKSCLLTVKEATLEKPEFKTQPQGADMKSGESVTLHAAASAEDGRIMYQWFSNTSNSTTGAAKIDGATSGDYTPPQTEGSVYYFCTAWAVEDDKVSETAYSTIVAVTYPVAAAEPETTPTTQPSSPEVSEAPAADKEEDEDKDKKSGSDESAETGVNGGGKILIIVIIIVLVAAIAAAVAAIILTKKGKEEVAPVAAASGRAWSCDECGAKNQGSFCTECGAPKPAGAPQYKCDKCGWEPVDPSDPPKFCPRCGDPFGDEDRIN